MRVNVSTEDKTVFIFLEGSEPVHCSTLPMREWFHTVPWPPEGADWEEFFPIDASIPWEEAGQVVFFVDSQVVGYVPLLRSTYDFATAKTELWYDLRSRVFRHS